MPSVLRFRLILVCVGIGLASVAIGYRLYWLQILNGDRFAARAEEQHSGEFTLPARRGALLDRHGRSLAVSLEVHSLYAHPRKLSDPDGVAKALAPIVPESATELTNRLREDKSFVYLSRHLTQEGWQRIRGAAASTKGLNVGSGYPLDFETDSKRSYPRQSTAAHVVGFADIDGLGQEGAEQRFEEVLQGDSTTYLALKDARGQLRREVVRPPARESQNVRLTLDLSLQHLVERELDEAMRSTGAHAASAIVLDPKTGQVLAMANRPTFDPAEPSRRRRNDARANRAIEHQFEPGSTFKIVPMALALESGKVNVGERIYCHDGRYDAGHNRIINDVGKNGMLTPRSILAKSSNIGMVFITRRLDPHFLREGILKFGFGKKTGIELPAETAGSIADVSRWSGFTQDSLSFGQEIAVTGLQVASSMATIANDGVRIEPRIGLGTDLGGELVPFEPGERIEVVSAATARTVATMLEDVVEKGSGTAARIPGYRVAGKSGTAQMAKGRGYSGTDFVASFVGFAPVSDPKLVVFVSLDTPRGSRRQGGEVAAPVFAKVLSEALQYLRIPRDAEPPLLTQASLAAAPSAPSQLSLQPGVMPDLRDRTLRESIAALSAQRARVRVEGSGRVVWQRPAPGEPLKPGQVCELRASTRDRIVRRNRRPGGAG